MSTLRGFNLLESIGSRGTCAEDQLELKGVRESSQSKALGTFLQDLPYKRYCRTARVLFGISTGVHQEAGPFRRPSAVVHNLFVGSILNPAIGDIGAISALLECFCSHLVRPFVSSKRRWNNKIYGHIPFVSPIP